MPAWITFLYHLFVSIVGCLVSCTVARFSLTTDKYEGRTDEWGPALQDSRMVICKKYSRAASQHDRRPGKCFLYLTRCSFDAHHANDTRVLDPVHRHGHPDLTLSSCACPRPEAAVHHPHPSSRLEPSSSVLEVGYPSLACS